MRRVLIALGLLAGLYASVLTACVEPRSAQCRAVCKREAECIDTTGSKMPFDEKECIAACAALEHDVADNGAKVKQHIDCVHRQPTCPAVLECK